MGALALLLATVAALPGGIAAETQAENFQIITDTKGAPGVFTPQDDGSIRHVQSGMVCPALFPNVRFMGLQVFKTETAGDDVGCDYGRMGPDKRAVSKLTIFVTRAPAGTTLDDVFSRNRQDVVQAHPDAVEKTAAQQLRNPATGINRTDYRATGYTFNVGGSVRRSELLVGVWGPWALEVRATYPETAIPAQSATMEMQADQMYDVVSPYLAFISASISLGATGFGP